MALSAMARDIHGRLPSDTYVETDLPHRFVAEVDGHCVLTGQVLDEICTIFAKRNSGNAHCTVDLRKHIIVVTNTECTYTKPKRWKASFDVSTESEKRAMGIANGFGTIDSDDLIPNFTTHTDGTHTVLQLTDILCVNHHAVRHYIEHEHGLTLAYDMDRQALCVHIPLQSKRKR